MSLEQGTGSAAHMRSISTGSNQQLEQFLVLAKTAKGVAVRELVKQAMEAKDVYFFGELLELPTIQELATDSSSQPYLTLLQIFAYGTFKDYLVQADSLPQMSPMMITKLRHLTVATIATKSKCLPYSTLLEELQMPDMRQLENLLISALYANVIRGKLDQQNSRLEIDWAIGRDIRPADLDSITSTLESWCGACSAILQGIQTQVKSSNLFLEEERNKKHRIEEEILHVRQTLKAATGHQDMEFSTSDKSLLRPMPSAGVEAKPKKSKVKGLRGSQAAKLWASKN